MRVELVRTFDFNVAGMIARTHEKDAPGALERTCEAISRSSVVWVGKADGVEVCAVGLIPVTILSDMALLWLTHTHLCEQHPLRFARWSLRVMKEAKALYPSIYGVCVRPASMAWLKWLGAEFSGQTFRIV